MLAPRGGGASSHLVWKMRERGERREREREGGERGCWGGRRVGNGMEKNVFILFVGEFEERLKRKRKKREERKKKEERRRKRKKKKEKRKEKKERKRKRKKKEKEKKKEKKSKQARKKMS